MPQDLLNDVISLAKRRGFIYPTSEIYGGLANAYDYGPLGVEVLLKLKNLWWQRFVRERPDMVGIDSQIILHPQTWVASGHVTAFNDALVEDKVTHQRYRADHLIEAWQQAHPSESLEPAESMSPQDMAHFIQDHQILSPEGNPLSEPKAFNLLFETALGTVTDAKTKVYLRGETAQGIFSDFQNVLDTTRIKLPFGIAQMGKSFRNEITQGQFIFRTFEFEQAEIEYFFNPEKSNWQDLFESWKNMMWQFVTQDLQVSAEHLRWRRHNDKERSHYSKETYDLDYQFPFGFKELWGLAYRTDYDLKQHAQYSHQELTYTDPVTSQTFTPHVIEPALGLNRLLLMLLTEAMPEKAGDRFVLKLPNYLAPYQVAVFPLLKNKPELVELAQTLYRDLVKVLAVTFDDRGNIGKRYYSQDEIGTPFCVTVDFDSLKSQTVTVRDRDTAAQVRVNISELATYIQAHLT